MQQQPPKRALQFLRWFCRPDYLEEIEGDLFELFEQDCEQSLRRANRRFTWQVLRHLRPDFIKSLTVINHLGMYQHYFKIAWRSMLKQKLYSGINIGGLAIGLSCFILIMLYIRHELSYDEFFSDANRTYRLYQRQAGNVYLGSDYFALTPAGLAGALREEVPEVVHATTIVDRSALLAGETNNFYEEGLLGDASFFDVFPFTFLQGDPKTALAQPASIVLTRTLAGKIFGRQDPIGQTLTYQNDQPFTVTGVVEDPPTNISLNFSYVASVESDEQYQENIKKEKWDNNSFHTFLILTENADPEQLESKVTGVFDRHKAKYELYPFEDAYYLQSLSDLHLTNHINFDIGLKGNARYISLFTLIAVLVLILACVNYMNLAIARSIKRALEVGLRKVIGARRGQLIGQFIGESILISSLGLVVALGLTYFLAPLFSYLLERPIALDFSKEMYLLPGLLALVVVVGIISGSYPALFMSSLRPTQVLKGKIKGRFAGSKVQKGLIIGQYATSIALIICSMVIYRQFQFIQNKELGYDREHIVCMRIRDFSLPEQREQLKSAFSKNPQIVSTTFSMGLPTNIDSSTIINDEEGTTDEDDMAIYEARGDENFLDVFGIELVAGRNFSPDIQTDVDEGYLINETAAAAMGWTPTEAIGKHFTHMGTETIIGVVKDFHMHSMHMAIEPLMIHLQPSFFTYISVKIRPENMQATLADLKATVKTYSPFPADFQFLDDKFNEMYQADLRLGEMFGFFTALSILIASLGLFGLAAFMARQRTKEVSIRKVLGASVQSIVQLLSKDFIRLVLFGFLLAIPVAWYVMYRWLQDFAYRVDIEWWLFAVAGVAAMLLALLTVGSQSLKAAFSNPAPALKSE
ncbi:MAG: ABC transporter permease [Saprospiraceae bacterium]|nr:ABC transporter permease [Lewinella sp.]